RDAFVNHPVRTREAVRTYAMVVGATCQQSAGMEMASLKSLGGIGDAGIVFDTVIIDEAARANPLDLFIPMSMAGTRVILVGDHRQLPHLLEPELEDEVTQEHDLNATQRLAFKDSLFERLWRQLKDRSDQDNFPRVVMLDTQFRMHPLLGQLVSEQFYEKEGLPPLKPGRAASAFHSNIPGYEGTVCGWLNVPLNAGPEGRRGNSPMRTAEVQRIAIEIKRLLEQGAASLSIGVITFYSAQRDAIFEELGQIGITERDTDTGAWGVSAPWNGVTTGGEEKLRIGTVDAFQGKEFDVVLLSIVRANASLLPGGANAEGYEKAANGKFGHLRLSNRMNVAMSRQRSLLVAVGDRAMAAGADNAGAVPALAAFLALCEGGYGVVR
ncbi:MAG: AAA domain-containing protein, partial [Janthinobacterium sp.]